MRKMLAVGFGSCLLIGGTAFAQKVVDVGTVEEGFAEYMQCRTGGCAEETGKGHAACIANCGKKTPVYAEYFKVKSCRDDCTEHPPQGSLSTAPRKSVTTS